MTAKTAAEEVAPSVKTLAADLDKVAEELLVVSTYEDMEAATVDLKRVSAEVTAAANKLTAAAKEWEVVCLDDINRIVAAEPGARLIRVVIKAIPTMHHVEEMVASFHIDSRLMWDVTNLGKLRHLEALTQALKEIVKSIPAEGSGSPFLSSLFGARKKRKKLIRDAAQVVREHGQEAGVGFSRISGRLLQELCTFLESPGGHGSHEYAELRAYLSGILDEPLSQEMKDGSTNGCFHSVVSDFMYTRELPETEQNVSMQKDPSRTPTRMREPAMSLENGLLGQRKVHDWWGRVTVHPTWQVNQEGKDGEGADSPVREAPEGPGPAGTIPKEGSSIASATEREKTSLKKVPVGTPSSSRMSVPANHHFNSSNQTLTVPKNKATPRARNAGAKRPHSDSMEVDGSVVNNADKAEKVTAESLFDDLFPSENVEDCPKKLSSSASADGCDAISPENMSKTRARKVVAKRKIKAVEDKSGSKHNKNGSALVSAAKAFSSKRMESACNVDEVTADQDSRKDNNDAMRDVSASSCKDTVTMEKLEGMHKSMLRCSERNKAPASDHDKENQQDHVNLSSKSDCGKGGLNSKFSLRSARNKAPASDHDKENRQDHGYLSSKSNCGNGGLISKFDPLRRTEKFFAEAAAGRWILKPDYLTSCNDAGKFLDEGPFEWSGTGLNEGETISFETPKKWRVIKQQMGHSAFYGMQIILYGQLIAPSLDTMKHAVRAGDGNILATSPPYTRFLNSGVDFAVISASMPSADAWVQEYISHNIPCVSADYLVEYVCKPGYPLDRHVLFKTNHVANKSLDKLLKNQQEVATYDLEELEDDDPADDLSCSVCGSMDRGEVMLICGS
ncbi:hypothetical protein ACQ4PT_068534 [Festuca glaucescens]